LKSSEQAVEIGLDAEIEVGLRAGDSRAKVGVARAHFDDGRTIEKELAFTRRANHE
jgi:AmiR/NasT family two-component response regulator